ncbi:barstar family protein [Bordetella sp. 02P26C-1]|uniref:barstar family protein n=1 Tax=Bordetella sp. 02P26C-1 TaxID=2683195 RepID=UPI0013547760|nr:barstar family protein [Bordetella sp. 02P26C-1]MVW79559.1 barstar family protein 2 [Bordetella sp. 02P26C-1]
MTQNGQSTLQRQLTSGGAIEHGDLQKEAVDQAARELGLAFMVAECDRARSRSAVLRAIAKAVDFPEYFGGNFDALYDCLCDTVLDQKTGVVLWLSKLHSGDPTLTDDAAQIASVCADVVTFAAENGRSFGYIIEHAGKHPDPEPGVAAARYGES